MDLLDEFSLPGENNLRVTDQATSGVCGLRTISRRERTRGDREETDAGTSETKGCARGRERILWSALVDESERGVAVRGGGNAKAEKETKTKRRTAGQASTSGFINSRVTLYSALWVRARERAHLTHTPTRAACEILWRKTHSLRAGRRWYLSFNAGRRMFVIVRAR